MKSINPSQQFVIQQGETIFVGEESSWKQQRINFPKPYKTIPLLSVTQIIEYMYTENFAIPVLDNEGFIIGVGPFKGQQNYRWQAIGELA